MTAFTPEPRKITNASLAGKVSLIPPTPPLLERLQRDARESLAKKYDLKYFDGTTYNVVEEFNNDLDTIITHTISQTIEELKREYEGEKRESKISPIGYFEECLYHENNGRNNGIQTCQDIADRLLGKKE